MKTALANKNGYNKERYTEIVRQRVKQKHPNKADEIALLRKEVAFLREVIESILGKKLPDTKFTAYNATVKKIQTEARLETNYNPIQ